MEINLSKWQTQVWDDTHRFKVINTGRRSGKTTLTALKAIDYACQTPKQIIWYISPQYKMSKSIMWELLSDYLPQQAIDKKNETELKIVLTNGSQIVLKGADNPDTLRGVRIDLCIFDEVAFIDRWDTVWKVIRPTLVDSKAECWFISTPNGFNHFKELAENDDIKYQYFHFTSYDNPFLDKEELDEVKTQMDEDSFAQEFLGEFRKMSGLIYKDFNRETHMVDIPQLDTNYTYSRALDFGFAHKSALVYFAIAPDRRAIYGYDGLYKSGLTEDDIAEIVKVKDSGRVITNPVADSAQPMSIESLARKGVIFQPVEKGQDSVKNGIQKVAELLRIRQDTGKPTLMFNKSLTWIADEFEKYRWIENKSVDNVIKEVPLKIDDDAMDAIRYFCMSYNKNSGDTKSVNALNQLKIKKWSI